MNSILNYQNNSDGISDDTLDIQFDLVGVPLGLANAIRRVLLSNIPVVAMNDKWDDNKDLRNIVIEKNTSVNFL